MITPIFDFVKKYAESDASRLHMPGHKGRAVLGCEAYDITEISGADVLYSANGIISESENNLSSLYGTAHSFYSTQGSTLAIYAMLYLATRGVERPLILAARNVHSAFIKAAALVDFDVEFIYPERESHLCECKITADMLRERLSDMENIPCAVYVTSPDYLGNMLDISALSAVCREFGLSLLVDNAHGAYLKFLENDIHPITLGAAMCSDSAHKTLPVLTGGAYLHISKEYDRYVDGARRAMSLFASTSPSYLTLCSLDLCNARLREGYADEISATAKRIDEIKSEIADAGLPVCSSEPLKITVAVGADLADHLREGGIEVEFSDNDYTVLMLTPQNEEWEYRRLLSVISSYKSAGARGDKVFSVKPHKTNMTIREASFADCEDVPVENAVGRICASPTVSCPPAVPIVISGEVIENDDIAVFRHYGIEKISVVK